MKITRRNLLKTGSKLIPGEWSLQKNEVLFHPAGGHSTVLRGPIVAAEPDRLVFSLTQKESADKTVTRTMWLKGRWQADPKNRLTFTLDYSGASNVFKFEGSWKAGPSNELIYVLKRTPPRRRSPAAFSHDLTFNGFWEIDESKGIAYVLDASDVSGERPVLRLRGAFQTSSILAKKGEIRYQIGGEVRRAKGSELALFGKWKVSRDLDLHFDMEYASGRKRSLVFGAEWSPAKGRTIALDLTTRRGDPLGARVTFTRQFAENQGEAFVRFVKDLEESRAEAGVSLRW